MGVEGQEDKASKLHPFERVEPTYPMILTATRAGASIELEAMSLGEAFSFVKYVEGYAPDAKIKIFYRPVGGVCVRGEAEKVAHMMDFLNALAAKNPVPDLGTYPCLVCVCEEEHSCRKTEQEQQQKSSPSETSPTVATS